MYEVEFACVPADLAAAFTAARIGEADGVPDVAAAAALLNGRIYNCVGSPPARPAGNRPAYNNAGRGPTPGITPFAVDSIGLTFPAQLVEADSAGARHYLPAEVAHLFNGLEILYGRRPDLSLQATLNLKVRRLFEQNDPGNTANAASAEALYSAVDEYPRVLVIYAGGDDTGFNVTLDVLQRPRPVNVQNYLTGGTAP